MTVDFHLRAVLRSHETEAELYACTVCGACIVDVYPQSIERQTHRSWHDLERVTP